MARKSYHLSLVDAQAGNVVGVAAIAEIAEGQDYRKKDPVVDRTHVHRVIEQAHAGREIFKRVVVVRGSR